VVQRDPVKAGTCARARITTPVNGRPTCRSPQRFPIAPKDWHGFERARLVSLLKGIATGAELDPVQLLELPQHDVWRMPYQYRVRDGFHRFYASIAAGFESLPSVIA